MIFYFDLSEGMENFKMSGKSQGIFKWMISGKLEFGHIFREQKMYFEILVVLDEV